MNDAIQLPVDLPLGAVVSIIFRTRIIRLNHFLKRYGLSAGQFPIMMYLMHNPGISQETLVKAFHIDRGTIARSVKKLEEAGYITRWTDPDNRRAVQLYLSDEGKKITPDLIQIDRDWESAIISSLLSNEQDLIKPMLQKIASASLQCIRDMGELEYGTCFTRGEINE